MTDPTIICPKCKNEIKLTESLAGPLLVKAREDYMAQLSDEKIQIANVERKRATALVSDKVDKQLQEIDELRGVLSERDKKLAVAQMDQAEAIKQKRLLADDRRELELNIERQVEAGLEEAYDRAKTKADNAAEGRISQKDEVIRSMSMEVENLRRKAEQASQQTQGEAQEIKIEEILKAAFPFDEISPVPKGEFGGDILQRVVTPGGRVAGTILWEVKHTKAWMDSWLPKLRADQQVAKAHTAALVTTTMPKGLNQFDMIEGVWVLRADVLVPVASLLRIMILEGHAGRASSEGVETKAVMVYKYLTGPNFKLRMQAIVEAFTTMNEDLLAEKKAITRQWAKREAQITTVMQSTVGMYGDLQGIAGKNLPAMRGLTIDKE